MQPYTGIIEGFFGREWTWTDRADYGTFLAENDFDFYIYAPKGDRFLRHDWVLDWPQETWEELVRLRERYSEQGVQFGIGLSPFDVQQNYDSAARSALLAKTKKLNQLKPDLLCVLFDDMKGDISDLAQIQADMSHLIADAADSERLVVCPSYYSDDPVLEKVFGNAPTDYLEDLGRLLDKRLDIFWTGPLVCSTDYPRDHLENVRQRLQRKPFLWDNYPVNDGAKKCNHLHLKPFRSHDITDLVSGHAINPMNQPVLSRLSLHTVQASHSKDYDAPLAFHEALNKEKCPAPLAKALARDLEAFHEQGLLEIDSTQFIADYQRLPEHPFRTEVLEWLQGMYEFDPACLTD